MPSISFRGEFAVAGAVVYRWQRALEWCLELCCGVRVDPFPGRHDKADETATRSRQRKSCLDCKCSSTYWLSSLASAM